MTITLKPLPNITYDVGEAKNYYEIVNKDFDDLHITKLQMVELISPLGNYNDPRYNQRIEEFLDYVGRVEPYISWTKEKIVEYMIAQIPIQHGNLKIWNIISSIGLGKSTKIDRQKELQFGFAKKIMEIFPNPECMELLYSPVGTTFKKHTDEGDFFRVIIPIVADEGCVWHTNDGDNITQFPGHAYRMLKKYPHGTDVFGPSPRINLHFLLKSEYLEWIENTRIHIE